MNITLLKALMLVVWSLILANLVVSFPGWLATTLNVMGLFLVIAHLFECAMFASKIRANHDNSLLGFVQVFLFGVLHLNTLPDFKQ